MIRSSQGVALRRSQGNPRKRIDRPLHSEEANYRETGISQVSNPTPEEARVSSVSSGLPSEDKEGRKVPPMVSASFGWVSSAKNALSLRRETLVPCVFNV